MENWKHILTQNIRSTKQLIELLELSPTDTEKMDLHPHFSLNIPQRIARKIPKKSLTDPLFLQYAPLKKTLSNPLFVKDPVYDEHFVATEKLLRKYNYRSLILASSACAMHCRHCFRQNFPYEKERKGFEKELEIIRADSAIHEVILSGGDPFSLDDRILGQLFDDLEAIPHVKIIRFHSRFFLGIPERVTPELLKLLSNRRFQSIMVLHINHVKELDEDIIHAIQSLQKLGIPILTATVLLKDVNDSFEALYELFHFLISKGLIPYYLFELDKVMGAERFYVEREKGIELIEELRKHLPGYGVPRFAVEIAGEPHKTIIA